MQSTVMPDSAQRRRVRWCARVCGVRSTRGRFLFVPVAIMTFGRKILIKNAALMVALVILAGVSMQGLLPLRASTRTVLTAYRQLQRIETAETFVTAAKSGLVRGQTSGPALT